MLRSIRYKSGAIHISSRLLYSHLPDDINLSALQHRLSYDELRDCWKRMQTCIASNVKTQKWLLGLFGVLFLIMLIMLLLKVNMNVVGLFWAFSFIICVIGMIINTIQMNKKLNHLIEKENHTIWNTRGLFWKYSVKAKRRKGKHSYLKLKVLKSAMSYNAPGQPFQGTLSNPYMQQPVNYIQQVELTNYGQQNQAIYGQQQPQYQHTYGQQQFQPTYDQQPQPSQEYPATNTYVGHPTYS